MDKLSQSELSAKLRARLEPRSFVTEFLLILA